MIPLDALKFPVSKRAVQSGCLSVVNLLISNVFRSNSFLRVQYALIFFLFFIAQNAVAEGSKDLYPSGVTGNRAFLYANTDGTWYLDRYPFKTRGTHFVYAKNGETIAVASSAIGYSNARIVITSPRGVVDTRNLSGSTGRIQNRSQELAGPRWGGAPTAGYTPITINVAAAEEGIWKIEFLAPAGGNTSSNIVAANTFADDEWTQQTGNNINLIAAWDVSVRNQAGNAWLTGRVYANVLNLSINNNFLEDRGFYVTNFVLTEDGRAYRVETNGNNGYAFTFFSNNNGFAVNGVPTYKSLNASTVAALSGLHDPRQLDNALNKTHKIFYNKPNQDLPTSANAFVTGANQNMWLKKNAILPIITDLKFTGVEGTVGKISRKGAKISFTSSTSGSFQIVIPVPNGANRVIDGAAVPGYNEVFWDGKDANGVFLSAGQISPLVQTFLRSAEVHFPYIDMEINPQGIIIELTENNTNYNVNRSNTNPAEYSDKVYWDDINISNAGSPANYSSSPVTNLTGQSSRTNGHKFGRYNNNEVPSEQFGNERSMDTWAYIESDRTTQLVNIEILEANLKIESITPDLSQYFSGNKITYTVRVQNDGPSAANGSKLAISLPAGLTIGAVTRTNISAGVVVNSPSATAQTYSAVLNLPNQGTIDFVIEATFTGGFTRVFENMKSSILRPADLTDPDATGNNAAGPVDTDEECLNGATTGVGLCNNIKYNTVNGQELCQGSNISPIVYTLSPDGTQFENTTPLPATLTAQNASSNRTVSGALSASGIQTFYVKTLNTKRTQTNVIIRSVAMPDATANGPASLCVDASGNPAISFKGSSSTGSYEFSYTINNGAVQTVSTPSGSDTATVPIPVTNNGTFVYKLVSVKDLTTGCSQAKNVEVIVVIHPKPPQTHIQLIQ